MLISTQEFERLGPLVITMLTDETTPTEFWTISDKIIDAHLYQSRMRNVPDDVKEAAKYHARIKLHNNIRKFDPTRWHKARADKGLKPLPNHNKGVYEFVCLVVRNNILKTITDTSKRASRTQYVQLFDVASTTDKLEIETLDLEITKYWLDNKLKSQGVTRGIGD